MFSRKIGMFAASLIATVSIGGPAAMAPANAAPAPIETSAKVMGPINAKKSTVSCNGETFNHNGLSYGLGNGMRFLIGFGSAGNPRMVKVFSNNGSLANFALGPISYSGAVVESWSYNVSSYCVTFPANKGIVIRTRQGGAATNDVIYW